MGRSGRIILVAAGLFAIGGCSQQAEIGPEPVAEATAPTPAETVIPDPAPAPADPAPPPAGESYGGLLPDGM